MRLVEGVYIYINVYSNMLGENHSLLASHYKVIRTCIKCKVAVVFINNSFFFLLHNIQIKLFFQNSYLVIMQNSSISLLAYHKILVIFRHNNFSKSFDLVRLIDYMRITIRVWIISSLLH